MDRRPERPGGYHCRQVTRSWQLDRRGHSLQGERGEGVPRRAGAKPIPMGTATSSLPPCQALNASLNSYVQGCVGPSYGSPYRKDRSGTPVDRDTSQMLEWVRVGLIPVAAPSRSQVEQGRASIADGCTWATLCHHGRPLATEPGCFSACRRTRPETPLQARHWRSTAPCMPRSVVCCGTPISGCAFVRRPLSPYAAVHLGV